LKKIFISGITGFIGSSLKTFLTAQGYHVEAISRSDFKLSESFFIEKISPADIIINLAGAPLNRRWTKKYKLEILNSRILTTRKIATAIRRMPVKPELFISASAIGIYNETGINDEFSKVEPSDFLKKLCIEWEDEALQAADYCNITICRLGVVLDKREGALKKLLPPFKSGLGASIGSGQQAFSWIHITDLLNGFHFIIEHKISGILNFTSPNPVTNKTFSLSLASVLKKKLIFSIPACFLRLLYGEGAIILIKGQHTIPKRLLDNNFSFLFPDIVCALQNLLKK